MASRTGQEQAPSSDPFIVVSCLCSERVECCNFSFKSCFVPCGCDSPNGLGTQSSKHEDFFEWGKAYDKTPIFFKLDARKQVPTRLDETKDFVISENEPDKKETFCQKPHFTLMNHEPTGSSPLGPHQSAKHPPQLASSGPADHDGFCGSIHPDGPAAATIQPNTTGSFGVTEEPQELSVVVMDHTSAGAFQAGVLSSAAGAVRTY